MLKNSEAKVDAKHSQIEPPYWTGAVVPTVKKNLTVQNTHRAKKVYSELCGREFDSKAELRYCEMLWMRQLAGEIKCLEFQHEYILSEKPKVSITVDASYLERKVDGDYTFWIPRDDDVKGWRLTPKTKKLVPRVERDFKVKLAWLKSLYNIEVRLVK